MHFNKSVQRRSEGEGGSEGGGKQRRPLKTTAIEIRVRGGKEGGREERDWEGEVSEGK